jgi:hypothetical protein
VATTLFLLPASAGLQSASQISSPAPPNSRAPWCELPPVGPLLLLPSPPPGQLLLTTGGLGPEPLPLAVAGSRCGITPGDDAAAWIGVGCSPSGVHALLLQELLPLLLLLLLETPSMRCAERPAEHACILARLVHCTCTYAGPAGAPSSCCLCFEAGPSQRPVSKPCPEALHRD